ncbi:hypothetical protein F2Q70_00028989 [Brassica cretica]|uniref:Peptidase M1 alanyl aminopeptidase Ig-like fold domain-containing protein n=1 Tax=Brassica cretica TaxID=69181 RepID=A0A8S9FJ29_BRACR|nr:hypothetical protein F2Q70_00028989 [Brassica cretica]
MGSRSVKHIADVSKLRIYQVPQLGLYFSFLPLTSVCEYITGYIDLYFQMHDEKAVTCEEDFFAAMRDANNADFANFLQYFYWSGTPVVKMVSSYDAEARTFSLKFSHEIPLTPGQPTKEPTLIPVVIGLLDSSGKDITLSSVYHDGTQQTISSSSTILRVTKVSQESFFKPKCGM